MYSPRAKQVHGSFALLGDDKVAAWNSSSKPDLKSHLRTTPEI